MPKNAGRPGRRCAWWKIAVLVITAAGVAGAIAVFASLVRELNEAPYPYRPYGPTNEDLTEDLAMRRIVHYLQQSADEIGVGFSLTPGGDNPGRPFSAYVTHDCYRGYRLHGPQRVELSMWVTGVSQNQSDEYFARLRDTWKSWPDWKFHDETGSTHTWAATESPDGYSFSISNPRRGDGWLSILVTSPCFPYRDSSFPTQRSLLQPYPDKELPDIVPASR
ncbi:hypothetical protein ACWDSJ_26230 [Nocardia sp. NPDC003482]